MNRLDTLEEDEPQETKTPSIDSHSPDPVTPNVPERVVELSGNDHQQESVKPPKRIKLHSDGDSLDPAVPVASNIIGTPEKTVDLSSRKLDQQHVQESAEQSNVHSDSLDPAPLNIVGTPEAVDQNTMYTLIALPLPKKEEDSQTLKDSECSTSHCNPLSSPCATKDIKVLLKDETTSSMSSTSIVGLVESSKSSKPLAVSDCCKADVLVSFSDDEGCSDSENDSKLAFQSQIERVQSYLKKERLKRKRQT